MDHLTLAEILQIVQIVTLICGGGYVAYRVGRYALSVDRAVAEIRTLQDDVKALNEIVTRVAVQNVRLDNHDQQLIQHANLIDDLRRGEGYILPIEPHLGRLKPK